MSLESSPEEDLLSLSSSPQDMDLNLGDLQEQNDAEPQSTFSSPDNVTNSHTETEELSISENPSIFVQPSTSTESISEETEASSNRLPTVHSFRSRVDENGETIFEFASGDEAEELEYESYSEPEVEIEHTEAEQPVQPPVINPPDDRNNLEEELNILRTLESIQYHQQAQTPLDSDDSDAFDSSSEDSDYLPHDGTNQSTQTVENIVGGGVGQRVAGRRGRTISSNTSPTIRQPGEISRRTRRGRPTARRRVKKKAKVKKIYKPPKPLVPKVIIEELNGNEDSKFYKPQISITSLQRSRTTIYFEYAAEDNNCQYLKVGEIFLDPNNKELLLPNSEKLLEAYVGLKNVFLHSNTSFNNFALIELITEETLSEEESALRPRPNLSAQDRRRQLIFILRKSYFFTCNVEEFPLSMFGSNGFGSKKVFRLNFFGLNTTRERLQLDVCINKSFVLESHDLSSIPYSQNKIVKEIFSMLFNIPKEIDQLQIEEDQSKNQQEDIPWFYGQIKKFHEKENIPEPNFSLQPDSIVPILRPYQKRAVHWMLYKEGVISHSVDNTDLGKTFLNKMYMSVTLDEKPAFYNPFVGYLCWSTPLLSPVPTGGILADEMGLGKTVEVICLILLNPRPHDEYESIEYNSAASFDDLNSESSDACNEEHIGQKRKSNRKRARARQISSSSEESDSRSASSNDSEYNGEKTRLKPNRKLEEDNLQIKDSTERMLHPRFSRRRKVSPCTYNTEGLETEETKHSNHSTFHSEEEPSTSKKRTRSRNNTIETEAAPSKIAKITKPKGKGTYAFLKALYDEELLGYSESANISKPIFGGKFFETKIMRRARFECICGETRNSDCRQIVECSACQSSQHADCVGFDKLLQRFYKIKKSAYFCPHCTALQEPFQAKTTLIVTPNSISIQWINELKRHVKKQAMKILHYKGVTNHGYIPPIKLAEYDLVITSYNVLAVELNYVDLPHLNSEDGRQFRNPKRFMTIPSPLPSVFWWRLCLDEAQMVEGINTKMSAMAMRLPSVHRWCITGTPVNDGLQDLFGLFAFLGVEPIAVEFWWKKLVQEPFYKKEATGSFFELLGTIWRMNKSDVLSELGIPPQTSIVRWLSFSAVEEHFYKQQYETCSRKILEKITKLSQMNENILQARLSSLDRQVLQSLLQPFLELRKACCHPQIVKGQTISLQKGTMTMEELLAQLIKKSSVQCSEDNRQIVASLNGMAGIHMIRENWLAASEAYRQVLFSAKQHEEHFSTDSLQLLHTMENLADLLDRNHSGIPYTLRDSSLRSEAEELKTKYLQNYADGVKSSNQAVQPHITTTKELISKLKLTKKGTTSWWAITLSKASNLGKGEDLVKRIKDDLIGVVDKKTPKVISLANKFNSAIGLERVLVEQLKNIENLREAALEGVEKLQNEDPSIFIHAAVSCHLRKKSQLYYKESEESGFRCQICQYHDKFIEYESLLFKDQKKHKVVRTGRKWQQQKIMGNLSTELTEEELNLVLLKEEEELFESLEDVKIGLSDELRRGTWGDSDTERTLKLINNFARINRLPEDVRQDGSTHIKLFDSMKKEFRLLRILWMKIYDQISKMDELSQATTRLCLKYDNVGGLQTESQPGPSTSTGSSRRKKKPKELQPTQMEQDQRIQNINLLERHELDMKMTQMEIERETGKESLSVHLGQLLYLETLKKNDFSKSGNINSEECPVCHLVLGEKWTVLRCGHCYCSDCVKSMCSNAQKSFLCPLCRHSMKYSDVSFIDNREHDPNQSPSKAAKKRDIKGSHSTKVEAILDCILQLQESHPGEKVIIFSAWLDVLEITAKALNQNDISNCLLNQQGKKFQTELDRFKTREDIQVLLMPLVSGAKGLNIIEATHILLVEPILSLASELQAIGRIHRIGQTKTTFVHRFYIKNTVEEQLFEVLKTHDVSSDTEGALTVKDLQNLINDGKNYSGPNEIELE